jgi:hypothetical protein
MLSQVIFFFHFKIICYNSCSTLSIKTLSFLIRVTYVFVNIDKTLFLKKHFSRKVLVLWRNPPLVPSIYFLGVSKEHNQLSAKVRRFTQVNKSFFF